MGHVFLFLCVSHICFLFFFYTGHFEYYFATHEIWFLFFLGFIFVLLVVVNINLVNLLNWFLKVRIPFHVCSPSVLACTCCLHRPWGLASGESLSICLSFLGMCTAMHMPVDFYIPRKMPEHFKMPVGFHPPVVLSKLVDESEFDLPVFTSLGSCDVTRCPWLFLMNTLGIELFTLSRFQVKSNKKSPLNGAYLGVFPKNSNSKYFLGAGLFRKPQTRSAPASGFWLAHL